MISVTATINIDRPAPVAFALVSDFERNPEWQRGMVSCTFTTDPPLRVGSRYDQEARFLGRPIISTFEVLQLDADRMVKATTVSGTFPITFTRTVTPDGPDRCVVTALVEGDASGVFRIAAPLIRQMVQRSVRSDYRRLKTLLEGSR